MSKVAVRKASWGRGVLVGILLLLSGCGELHYVSPELSSPEDPRAARLLFPFYIHSGYHRIDHLNLEKINDIDIRGYAGALVPAGTYRFLYDCRMDRDGKPFVQGEDRVKTLILKPGHSYLLRTVTASDGTSSECRISVHFCEPGQQIEKTPSRYMRDSWSCRAG